MDCHTCTQWTDDWHVKWGCIGNPDNNNQGCEHYTPDISTVSYDELGLA